MIQNILFDMGNVMIGWKPAHFVERLGYTGKDVQTLVREVYGSVDWVMLDRGSLTDAEAVERIRARLPERLRPPVEELVSRWDSEPMAVPGMWELAGELADKGYGLYLLTNAGLRHREDWPKFAVSKLFGDRIMLSSAWKLLKPEAEFYRKAFELFSLDPGECLFVDDNPPNIEAGQRLGLDGLVFFGDASLLRRQLREKGVDVEP